MYSIFIGCCPRWSSASANAPQKFLDILQKVCHLNVLLWYFVFLHSWMCEGSTHICPKWLNIHAFVYLLKKNKLKISTERKFMTDFHEASRAASFLTFAAAESDGSVKQTRDWGLPAWSCLILNLDGCGWKMLLILSQQFCLPVWRHFTLEPLHQIYSAANRAWLVILGSSPVGAGVQSFHRLLL